MPYDDIEYLTGYEPRDIVLLQSAYEKCCDLMGGRPTDPQLEEMIANLVLRAFEDNSCDPDLAAQQAYELIEILKHKSVAMHRR